MKSNPAILILVGVVVYVAVTLFGVSGVPGEFIFTATWSVAALTAGIIATARTTGSSVFARGLVAGLAFGVLAFHGPKVGVFLFAQKTLDHSVSGGSDSLAIVKLAIAFAIGVICGCLALWLYRRQERKRLD